MTVRICRGDGNPSAKLKKAKGLPSLPPGDKPGEVRSSFPKADQMGKKSSHALSQRSRKRVGINLMTVMQACISRGIDPADQIAEALAATGDKALPQDVRIKLLAELLQYSQPKLKAVEVKLEQSDSLTPEQVDARIEALLLKQQRRVTKKSGA